MPPAIARAFTQFNAFICSLCERQKKEPLPFLVEALGGILEAADVLSKVSVILLAKGIEVFGEGDFDVVPVIYHLSETLDGVTLVTPQQCVEDFNVFVKDVGPLFLYRQDASVEYYRYFPDAAGVLLHLSCPFLCLFVSDVLIITRQSQFVNRQNRVK